MEAALIMDTNLVTNLNQVTQSVSQIVSLVASLASVTAILIATVGRILHAQKTGASKAGALVSGTNSPEPKI
jgi:uncharacterized protein YqgC (DUF456 family)